MHSLKKIYKSIAYSRRGESLIQAPPESLHANTFFSVADLKTVYYYYIPTLLDDPRRRRRPPRGKVEKKISSLPLKFPLCWRNYAFYANIPVPRSFNHYPRSSNPSPLYIDVYIRIKNIFYYHCLDIPV
jgi:hypothetical protein